MHLPIDSIWQKSPNDLGLQFQQKQIVEDFLATLIHTNLQSKIHFQPPEKDVEFEFAKKKWKLSIDTHVLYDENGKINHFILSPNCKLLQNNKFPFVIMNGKERSARTCYDLLTGKVCVEKRVSLFEKKVLTHLPETAGLPKIYGFYKAEKGLYVVEKLYDETLFDAIVAKKISNTKTKLNLMRDILEGLLALHEIPILQEDGINTYACMHNDIKLKNILLKQKKDRKNFTAVLTDFKSAGNDIELFGSPIFFSPEFCEFIKEHHADPDKNAVLQNCMAFQHNYGRAKDIWALGLIFIFILKNEITYFDLEKTTPAPPLVSLQENFKDWETSFGSISLIEKPVIKELKTLKSTFQPNPTLYKVAHLIEKMLKFSAQKRPNAKRCLNTIKLILASQPIEEYLS